MSQFLRCNINFSKLTALFCAAVLRGAAPAIWSVVYLSVCQAIPITKEDAEISVVQGSVQLVIKLQSKLNAADCLGAASFRWGTDQSCPKSRIAAMNLKRGDNALFVPYSAFADLGNPSSIKIVKGSEKARFVVKIDGGDGGAAYSATLQFRDGYLVERMVRHGEFPDEAWERTIYRYNTKTN